MRKRLSVILVLIAVFVVLLPPVLAKAQEEAAGKLRRLMENTTPQQRARFEDRWMKRDLNLSKNQAAKIGKINLRTVQRMQSIFDSDRGRFRKFREVMRARDEKDRELKNVLTREQFTKYQRKKEEMWQKMQEMK